MDADIDAGQTQQTPLSIRGYSYLLNEDRRKRALEFPFVFFWFTSSVRIAEASGEFVSIDAPLAGDTTAQRLWRGSSTWTFELYDRIYEMDHSYRSIAEEGHDSLAEQDRHAVLNSLIRALLSASPQVTLNDINYAPSGNDAVYTFTLSAPTEIDFGVGRHNNPPTGVARPDFKVLVQRNTQRNAQR